MIIKEEKKVKRRVLLGVLAIALIAGLVGAFTYAWFSDVETTSASFQAGIMDLELTDYAGGAFSLVLDDLKPCEVQYAYAKLHVASNSNGGPVYFHIANVKGSQGQSSDAEADAEAQVGAKWDIYNWITFDLYIDKNHDKVIDAGDEVIIHPDDHMKLGDLESVYIKLAELQPSNVIYLILSFHLQAETGNEYQGDIATADLEFGLQQVGAPQPGNRIILENKVPSGNWPPILGDGIWGIAEYNTTDLTLGIVAQGLPANQDVQISINSPEDVSWFPVDATTRVAMASALASGVYDGTTPGTAPPSGYNLYERGYWDSAKPNLGATFVTGDIGTFTTSKSGVTPQTNTSDANGDLTTSVSFPLPSGAYSFIKVVIKQDASPYTPYLMEKDTPMFFTIP